MSSKTELENRFSETLNIIQWAIAKIPPDRLLASPPHASHPHSDKGFKTYFGEWSAMRHIFHLVFYEETFAIPAMQHCLDGSSPQGDIIFPQPELEQRNWQNAAPGDLDIPLLQIRFRELDEHQRQLIQEFPGVDWEKDRVMTGMGSASMEFVTSKTVQHRIEHANDLLKNALYWERALDWLNRQVDG